MTRSFKCARVFYVFPHTEYLAVGGEVYAPLFFLPSFQRAAAIAASTLQLSGELRIHTPWEAATYWADAGNASSTFANSSQPLHHYIGGQSLAVNMSQNTTFYGPVVFTDPMVSLLLFCRLLIFFRVLLLFSFASFFISPFLFFVLFFI